MPLPTKEELEQASVIQLAKLYNDLTDVLKAHPQVGPWKLHEMHIGALAVG